MAQDPGPRDIAAALRVTIGLLGRRLRQFPAREGLTLPETSALSRLTRSGPATAAELARSEQITPQAMSATLSALEERHLVERHLVERRPDPADGRRVIMSLTEDGRQAVRDKRTAVTGQLVAALSGGFTREELLTLEAAVPLLDRLREKL